MSLPDRTKQWDDWVPGDRVRKFTDENKELAAQLHNQMKALQRAPKSVSKKRANGSDFSSARGSEERHTSVAAQGGRGGARRNRDYDLEHVSIVGFLLMLLLLWCLSDDRLCYCCGSRRAFPYCQDFGCGSSIAVTIVIHFVIVPKAGAARFVEVLKGSVTSQQLRWSFLFRTTIF